MKDVIFIIVPHYMHYILSDKYLSCLSIPHQIEMDMQNAISIMILIWGSPFSNGIRLGGTLQSPKE